MDGAAIIFLIVFNLVMLAWLVAGLWALGHAPRDGFLANIGAALIDAAWRVLRWWRRRKAARRG